MDLKEAKVLIAAQYAAPYEGNFIASIKELQNRIVTKYNGECAFVFPKAILSQPWGSRFVQQNKVFLSDSVKDHDEAVRIIQEFEPSIIYTHFEGYDNTFQKAIKQNSKSVRIVWHMHDTLGFHPNKLKALYQVGCFFRHYGLPYLLTPPPKKLTPCIIGVCEHEPTFIRPFRLGRKTKEIVIPNGIKLSRITSPSHRERHNPFTFLAFAGRNVQKRADLLLRAADILEKNGESLRIIIVESTEPSIADEIFEKRPNWLTVIKPRENINELFAMADCFVSTSVHETFSYAIAEASIYGLPVIQSDIEGTLWNSHNPSTFLFKSLDIQDLANAMLKVMSISEDRIKELCQVTALENSKNYSLEAWANKVTDFFESIP